VSDHHTDRLVPRTDTPTPLEASLAERLAGIAPYRPGRPAGGLAYGKLSSNESPFAPSPAMRLAVADVSRSMHYYPEQHRAREALARHLDVPPEQLLLTNGSDELCHLVASLLLGPGTAAVLGDPCYSIDASVSLVAGAELRRIPLVAGGHDLQAMAQAAEGASVVWLPTPHNPTGVAVDPDALESFLALVPPDCLVVLDEAYRAFADPARRPDSIGLLTRHDNLLVQRTFSKDAGLAGLRIGYAIGSPVVAEALSRVRAPFSVSSVALAAIEAALADPAWQEMTVARVRAERARLETHLELLGVEYYPSSANFVTARLDHARLAEDLERAGLSVRPGEDLGISGWVRMSIGWAPTMARLRTVLSEVVSRSRGTSLTRSNGSVAESTSSRTGLER
jgi:histidinol-phosphate aminotransferase